MASRRLPSSILPSSLLQSLKESQLDIIRVSSSNLTRHFSSIPMGMSKSNTWQKWGFAGIASVCGGYRQSSFKYATLTSHFIRCVTTEVKSCSTSKESFDSDITPRIKFKRLDKTANHIMKILDKEAVEEVRALREIPEIKPGYIVQLKVEVPENKRRVSLLKGIVIARRNAGLNSTFRIRRLVAGGGVESVFPLYSPNITEIKVIDKKKVRRAKLYYLRDKMNALKKQ